MAGPGGAFAMKMMQDPQLQQRVLEWNKRFMQSNQGMEFNKAQMGMMAAGAESKSAEPKGQQQQPAQEKQQQQQGAV